MDKLFCQIHALHAGGWEALALGREPANIDGLFRAKLHTAQTANAVGAEGRPSILQHDVAARTDSGAGAAANTGVIDPELLDPLRVHPGKTPCPPGQRASSQVVSFCCASSP